MRRHLPARAALAFFLALQPAPAFIAGGAEFPVPGPSPPLTACGAGIPLGRLRICGQLVPVLGYNPAGI